MFDGRGAFHACPRGIEWSALGAWVWGDVSMFVIVCVSYVTILHKIQMRNHILIKPSAWRMCCNVVIDIIYCWCSAHHHSLARSLLCRFSVQNPYCKGIWKCVYLGVAGILAVAAPIMQPAITKQTGCLHVIFSFIRMFPTDGRQKCRYQFCPCMPLNWHGNGKPIAVSHTYRAYMSWNWNSKWDIQSLVCWPQCVWKASTSRTVIPRRCDSMRAHSTHNHQFVIYSTFSQFGKLCVGFLATDANALA